MFRGILYFIRFSFKHKKTYLFARVFVELAKIAVSLTQIIMPGYVLDELFGEQRGDHILLYLGILLGISMIGGKGYARHMESTLIMQILRTVH